MSLRYKGGLISPSVNPLAANVTTSPSVAQYNGVFNLQEQGRAITSGEWCTDPYYKNTTLLLHADGKANGSQNNTFLDSSTNNFTITRNGNTTQGSFTPYGPDWSNYFNGSSYLSFANSADFQFGTGDFTIECWTNLAAIGSAQSFLSAISGASTGFDFGVNGSGYLYLDTWVGATNQIITATNNTLTANNWIHIAVTNTSGTFRLFVNGVSCTFSSSISQAVGCGANAVQVGHMALSGYPHWLTGYVSNLRVVKGTSVYTSNFTPSTVPLTAITNTTLLTCTSNSFADINTQTTAKTATVSGTPSVQRFSPFAPQYQYTPGVIGGSGYFDGTGDSLSLANSSNLAWSGSVDGSMEAWVYLPSFSNTPVIISKSDISGSSYPNYDMGVNTSGKATGYVGNSGSPGSTIGQITGATTLAINAWNHIVFTRKYVGGGSQNEYRLFVNGVLDAYGTNSSPSDSRASTCVIGGTAGGTNALTGYVVDVRFSPNSIPTSYQTTSTTVGTAIFTPSTTPLTTTSQGATNVSLLTNMTNAGITDNAMMNNLETVGNAQVSTSVVKYGSGSLYFDGTGDWLVAPANPSYNFGAGNLTWEMWINTTSSTQYATLISKTPSVFGTGMWSLLINNASSTSGDVALYVNEYANGTHLVLANSVNIRNGAWHHIAVVRNGSSWAIYVDGISGTPNTWSGAITDLSASVYIGADQNYGRAYTGYIDDLRITKGVARYTANFQPPKVAFANQ